MAHEVLGPAFKEPKIGRGRILGGIVDEGGGKGGDKGVDKGDGKGGGKVLKVLKEKKEDIKAIIPKSHK